MAKKVKTEKGADHVVTVFVYGSLKKGLGNHSLMSNIEAKFVGFDSISGQFSMVSYGGFPAVCHDTKVECAPVYGQVFEIPPEGLRALDSLEGHPRWYKREKLRTDVLDKRAWIYLMPESETARAKDIVPHNMWRVADDEEIFWSDKDVNFALDGTA